MLHCDIADHYKLSHVISLVVEPDKRKPLFVWRGVLGEILDDDTVYKFLYKKKSGLSTKIRVCVNLGRTRSNLERVCLDKIDCISNIIVNLVHSLTTELQFNINRFFPIRKHNAKLKFSENPWFKIAIKTLLLGLGLGFGF